MKKSQGFTLIELVVVIVILGILAVNAAPRFLGVTKEARVATLKSAAGSIKAANGMVYGKAAMQGLEKAVSGAVKVDGKNDILVQKGSAVMTVANINEIIDTDLKMFDSANASDPVSATDPALKNGVVLSLSAQTANENPTLEDTQCYLLVTNNGGEGSLTTTIKDKGC